MCNRQWHLFRPFSVVVTRRQYTHQQPPVKQRTPHVDKHSKIASKEGGFEHVTHTQDSTATTASTPWTSGLRTAYRPQRLTHRKRTNFIRIAALQLYTQEHLSYLGTIFVLYKTANTFRGVPAAENNQQKI